MRWPVAVGVVAILLVVGVSVDCHSDEGGASAFVAGEILVRPMVGTEADEMAAIRGQIGATYVRTLLSGEVEMWRVPVGLEETLAADLEEDDLVLWAEPNYLVSIAATVPDDPFFGNQWGHTRIGSTSAWDRTTGSDEIVIAIIDSGVDPTHPDLIAKLTPGYDFVDDDSDPTDLNAHGTGVAGIAAAMTDNGVGVAGMSWGAMLMPVRAMDENGQGTSSDVTDSITWAAANGADVVNLSLGGTSYSHAMQDAVNTAHGNGILIVAAMGNERLSGNATFYPAAYDNVLAVAATNSVDEITTYSSFGAHCDIAAPGGELDFLHDPAGIFTTTPTYPCTLTNLGAYNDYDYGRGTSAATPFVSGLAALVLAIAPNFSPNQVQAVIESTAQDLGPAGWDEDFGWGLIDSEEALVLAAAYIFCDGFESGDTSAW